MPPKAWNPRTKRSARDFIRSRATINYNESSLQQKQLEEAASALQQIRAAVKRRPRRKRVETQPAEDISMRKDGVLIPFRKEKLRDDLEIFMWNVVTTLQKNVTTIQEQEKTIFRLRKQRNAYKRKCRKVKV
jgi:hypothetical protein